MEMQSADKRGRGDVVLGGRAFVLWCFWIVFIKPHVEMPIGFESQYEMLLLQFNAHWHE